MEPIQTTKKKPASKTSKLKVPADVPLDVQEEFEFGILHPKDYERLSDSSKEAYSNYYGPPKPSSPSTFQQMEIKQELPSQIYRYKN